MNTPQRIQLSRKKGWRLPENTIVVSRPSKFGNPFKVENGNYVKAVREFRKMLKEGKTPPFSLADIRDELRGKNLACWCPEFDKNGAPVPCHANVLLFVANA